MTIRLVYMQPLLASVPLIQTCGNHETETLALADNATFTAANARYPVPQARAWVDAGAVCVRVCWVGG